MRRSLLPIIAIAATLFGAAGSAQAQSYGPGPADRAWQVRVGAFFPDGGGEVWDVNEDVFTLAISDFDDVALGFSFVTSVNNNVEVGFNADFYDSTVLSGYRDFVDEDGFAILHDTRLETLPLTVDIRLLPGGRYRNRPGGRAVLQPVFYVGGGLGVTLWEYEEVGDFIDFDDPQLSVGFARFVDDGAAFETHVLGGVELPLSHNINLMFEGRYSWADDQFELGRLELGGPAAYAGLSFHF